MDAQDTEETLVKVREFLKCNQKDKDWRWQLKNAVTKMDDLACIFPLDDLELEGLKRVVVKYPCAITPYYLSLIDKTNPADPIGLQCVPSQKEDKLYFDVCADPLGEEKDSVLPGLVHRYPDRVLLTLTNICPVYCRHCTRKRDWCGGKWVRRESQLHRIYEYIYLHKKIRDVIVSGGDPLTLPTEKIESVLQNLRAIPHVEIIRIGTRCPVVLPQRIDDKLVSMLKRYRPIWINTHFNHPNEITRESSEACDKMLCAGIPVNNQSVLLKDVNDNVETMTRLCQGLLKIGIRPYYLFQCDPVSGTGHFRTPLEKGLEIIKGMRGFTSGLCIPMFVIDGPDGQGKVPLQPDYLVSKDKDSVILKGYKNRVFKYYNPGE